MSNYQIHEDFKKIKMTNPPIFTPLLPLFNGFLKLMFNIIPKMKGIKLTTLKILGFQNDLIKIKLFEKENQEENAPCIVFFHGGGFVSQGSPHYKNLMMNYVLDIDCKIVYVDYRLGPKYVFPVGVEDCYRAYMWVLDNAKELKINPSKIALAGDSAGGAMVAAVNAMAHDRMKPVSCFQMMIYPVTDSRQNTKSMECFQDTPIWNAPLNAKMWKTYLKNGYGLNKGYASISELNSFEYFPNTYIEVAEFDCLHDEGLNFHNLLKKAAVKSEIIERTGAIHGFEIVMKSQYVQQCIKERIEVFKKAFI
ncbi:MAG: alpha/beta hydrolase [Tenericutes bacterium]|nr:alpha/beta hydrolase [Mycoplasmatota bacterium]